MALRVRGPSSLHRADAWLGAALFVIVFACPVYAGEMSATDWPQWGDRNRDFKVDTPAVLCVAGRLYTMHREGRDEVVSSLDAADGRTLWEHRYTTARYANMTTMFGEGPNATPLVTTDRLITIGFGGDLRCLSLADGALLWRHDLLKEYGHQRRLEEFGYSCSPLEHRGLILAPVGGERVGVAAFRASDGSLAWESAADNVGYAAPSLITVDGQEQVVFFSPSEVTGIAAADGKPRWRQPCLNPNENNCTSAIQLDPRHVWAATQTTGATRVLRIKAAGDSSQVEQAWFNPKVRVFHWNVVCAGTLQPPHAGNIAA